MPMNHTHLPGRLLPLLSVLILVLGSLPVQVFAEVTVGDAWARATPPGARTGAVYLSLENSGADRVHLVSAETDVADRAELHTHVHEDGMMRMEQVEAIGVPAGGTASLKPHGDHLMLIGLQRALAPGDSIAITLAFDDGSRIELDVPVRDGRRR